MNIDIIWHVVFFTTMKVDFIAIHVEKWAWSVIFICFGVKLIILVDLDRKLFGTNEVCCLEYSTTASGFSYWSMTTTNCTSLQSRQVITGVFEVLEVIVNYWNICAWRRALGFMICMEDAKVQLLSLLFQRISSQYKMEMRTSIQKYGKLHLSWLSRPLKLFKTNLMCYKLKMLQQQQSIYYHLLDIQK